MRPSSNKFANNLAKRLIPTHPNLLLLIFFLLTACARPALQPDNIVFGENELPKNWSLKGRISVQLPNHSWQAAIHWNQQGEDFKLSLHNPFGQVLGQIEKQGQDVVLADGDGHNHHHSASELNHLISQQIGIPVPVDSLRYWILGEPQPGQPWQPLDASQANTQGFSQANWNIHLNRWSLFDGRMLPSRLMLQRDKIKLKFALHNWVATPAEKTRNSTK